MRQIISSKSALALHPRTHQCPLAMASHSCLYASNIRRCSPVRETWMVRSHCLGASLALGCSATCRSSVHVAGAAQNHQISLAESNPSSTSVSAKFAFKIDGCCEMTIFGTCGEFDLSLARSLCMYTRT